MFTIDFSKYFYYNYFIKTERILFMDSKKIKVRKRVKVEKRIDNVRAYVIWDVFSDITVLQTMLAQDGLVKDKDWKI